MGMVRPDIGSQMVDLCAALLLVTCFAIVAQRRLSACVDVPNVVGVPPCAFGQWLAADLHDVQST